MNKWAAPRTLETKFFRDAPLRFEWKFAVEGTGEFEGYGAVFNNVDYYRDLIEPGAFTKTLAEHAKRGTMPKMLWYHDQGKVIGAWSEVREDERGLFVRGRLDLEKPDALKAYGYMKGDGSCDLSIGYTAMVFQIDRNADLRTISEIWLDEVSLAPKGAGANPEAMVVDFKAREPAAEIQTIREFEDFLWDVGKFSRTRAKAIASAGFKAASSPRDEDGKADLLAGIARLRSILSS